MNDSIYYVYKTEEKNKQERRSWFVCFGIEVTYMNERVKVEVERAACLGSDVRERDFN